MLFGPNINKEGGKKSVRCNKIDLEKRLGLVRLESNLTWEAPFAAISLIQYFVMLPVQLQIKPSGNISSFGI